MNYKQKKKLAFGKYIAPFATIITLSILVISVFFFLKKIEDKTQYAIQKVEKAFGLSVIVRESKFNTGSVEFNGITFGDEALAMVGKVQAKINLNPFAGKVGFANKIQINGLRLKMTPEQLMDLSKSMQEKARSKSLQKKNSRLKDLSISINNANIEIVNNQGQNIIEVKKSDFVFQASKGWRYLVRSLSTKLYNHQGTLSGKVAVKKYKGHSAFVLNSKNKSQYNYSVMVVPALNQAKVKWQTKGLPDQISNLISSYTDLPQKIMTKGHATLTLGQQKNTIDFKTFAHTKGFKLSHSVISKQALSSIPISVKAVGSLNYRSKKIKIHDGVIAYKGEGKKRLVKAAYQLEVRPSIQNQFEVTSFVDLVNVPCQDIISSIPRGLAPHLNGFKLKGTFSTSLELSLLTKDLASLDLRMHHTKNNCKVSATPPKYSLAHLKNGKYLSNKLGGGLTIAPAGRKTGRKIIPFAMLPKTVKLALVASEDTGFWKHNGFEMNSMIQALKRNLADGEVKVGGSTITMQTVKNLFLSKERTLSRKIEEMFLTWYIESNLTKERIFELYANIIEFGPNLYGIEYASYKIFGKDIHKLGLKEALFLATLLPSPGKRFANACSQQLTPGFQKLMMARFERLRQMSRIPAKVLNEHMKRPLKFVNSLNSEDAKCQKFALATQKGKAKAF